MHRGRRWQLCRRLRAIRSIPYRLLQRTPLRVLSHCAKVSALRPLLFPFHFKDNRSSLKCLYRNAMSTSWTSTFWNLPFTNLEPENIAQQMTLTAIVTNTVATPVSGPKFTKWMPLGDMGYLYF